MDLDAVLKVGGSLSRRPGLPALCGEISRLGRHRSLLVVPGGGKFADQVRDSYLQYGLNETAAHSMALLAMDQYGYILNHLIRDSRRISDFSAACEAAKSGRVAILLPSTTVIRTDPLPHSWQVTSDTIAAWIARRSGSRRLVLLKCVDGLIAADKLVEEASAEKIADSPGVVDEFLSRFLACADMETWILNGLFPGRLSELLETGETTGTRIKRSHYVRPAGI